MTILYIAGYGRSGSTLIDTILGNHPQVFGGGEISWLFRLAASSDHCSCGDQVDKCHIWGDVLKQTNTTTHRELLRSAHLTKQYEMGTPHSDELSEQYIALWRGCFRNLSQITQAQVIVDSSKTTRLTRYRMQGLTAALPGALRIMHLIRDPRAVMYSVSKGSNRKLNTGNNPKLFGGAYRGLFSWIRCNLIAEEQIAALGLSATRILYSDFANEPELSIKKILSDIDIDPAPLCERLKHPLNLLPGHGVSGNRMRRSPITVIREDNTWRTMLPKHQKILASTIAWQHMKRYGINHR